MFSTFQSHMQSELKKWIFNVKMYTNIFWGFLTWPTKDDSLWHFEYDWTEIEYDRPPYHTT